MSTQSSSSGLNPQSAPELESWRRAQAKKILQKYPVEKIKELVKEHGSPMYVLSIPTVREQYQTLKNYLPRVKHHFALKPMPHEEIVMVIKELDGYFDLATNGEVDLVQKLGIDPARTIHTHPIKRPSDIEHALAYGTKTFVFDNAYEFEKHVQFKDRIQVLMRLSFPNKEAQCDLSAKFGVLPDQSFEMLKKAVGIGYNVIGLSFHVGSQMGSPAKHIEAITFASELLEKARKEGINLKVLDMGGGFPVTYTTPTMPFEDFVKPIAEAIDDLVPDDVELYSEPGRFVTGPSMTLFSSVMGKALRNNQEYYYLDDGLYGSYSGKLFDHGDYLVFSLQELENPEIEKFKSTLAGPTCDSIDVSYTDILMPKMELGDILVSPVMGAYSAAHATTFNFLPKAKVVVEK
ncbi:MAG: type III PLP-dependent enzyme [Patescibacteria group bacterium]